MREFFFGATIACFICLMMTAAAAQRCWRAHQRGETYAGTFAAAGVALCMAVVIGVLAGLAYKIAFLTSTS